MNLAFAGSTPLVLYTFNEGSGSTVHDVSGSGQPLNLIVSKPAAVTWNTNGSLKINADTLIASSTAATKVIDALKASNAITIEAWIQPGNTTQNGPARILTLSKDSRKRNFTLGQEEVSYIGRLRTTKTDTNGKPQIATPAGTLNTSLTHVVYSRDTSGTVKLFINGVKQKRTTIGGNFGNWDSSYRLALGNELDGGRPWLGTFHQLAIYDRAFSATDVSQAYATGNNVPVKTTTSSATTTSFDTIPLAVNDSVSSSSASGIFIEPLTNDSGLTDGPITLRIISEPTRGSAYIIGTKISYLPTNRDFTGTDSFTYQVMDADGDRATATVSIKVTCSTCASVSNESLSLSWKASAGSPMGYYVLGASASSGTTVASFVQATETTFTILASDHNLQIGEQVCFRVAAYNSVGWSPFSHAVCSTI